MDNEKGQIKITEDNEVQPYVPVKIARWRRSLGYTLIFVSLLSFAVIFVLAYDRGKELVPSAAGFAYFDYIRFSLYGLFTSSCLAFLYAILHLGERFAVPAEWVRNSDDLRLILGGGKLRPKYNDDDRKLLKTILEIIQREVKPK